MAAGRAHDHHNNKQDALQKIDRPLFPDYWPRFIECLKALDSKRQRTVYRLTIVKAWNDDEVKSYASLVELGHPDFIEVKVRRAPRSPFVPPGIVVLTEQGACACAQGVTFCGDSKASTLTMENVPWHEDVVAFVTTLASTLPDYEVVSEHEHSNCLLIAHKKVRRAWPLSRPVCLPAVMEMEQK